MHVCINNDVWNVVYGVEYVEWHVDKDKNVKA